MRQRLGHLAGPLAKYLLYAAFAVCVFDHALALDRETARLRSQCRRIRAQIAHIRRQNAQREQVRKALALDPFYVERVLRERYGYRSVFALVPGGAASRRARE